MDLSRVGSVAGTQQFKLAEKLEKKSEQPSTPKNVGDTLELSEKSQQLNSSKVSASGSKPANNNTLGAASQEQFSLAQSSNISMDFVTNLLERNPYASNE